MVQPSALAVGKIDDKFEFRGLLYRKVAGLLTSEDPINICSHLAKLIDKVRTIRTLVPPASTNKRKAYIAGIRCLTASSTIDLLYNS